MILNSANLKTLYIAMSAAFASAFAGVQPTWNQIATQVPSTTAANEYGWLGQFPRMREWLGDRVVKSLSLHSYTIKNKTFEATVGIPRESIEDDQYGIYTPLMAEMGQSAAEHPDELIYSLLLEGFSTLCYDGQNFFDTDHPVLDVDGNETSVSNHGGGAAAAWFLLDTTRALKPLILQMRRPAKFVAKTSETDDNVFDRKEFVYGVDGRWNVGFGLWQMAYGSKQAIDATAFNNAYAALAGMKGDYGKPLGIKPKLLVVGPSNRAAALEVVKAERNAAGATNINKDVVDVLVVPWLP